jgi:regulator of replication initiation timing
MDLTTTVKEKMEELSTHVSDLMRENSELRERLKRAAAELGSSTNGAPKNDRKWGKVDDTMRTAMVDMMKKGARVVDVAKHFKLSGPTAYVHLKKAGWKGQRSK